jgi:hypothetical protein
MRTGHWGARNLSPRVAEMDPLSHFPRLHQVAEALKPAKDRVGERRCLGCGRLFISASCGNRICENCRIRVAFHTVA